MFKDCQTNLPGATSPGQTGITTRTKGSHTVLDVRLQLFFVQSDEQGQK